MRHFFRIRRLSCRHAITLYYIKRYVIFSEFDDYPTDMRNTNSGNMLRQMRRSGCRADMRKMNVYNGLRQTPIVATRTGGVRARPATDSALSHGVRRLVRCQFAPLFAIQHGLCVVYNSSRSGDFAGRRSDGFSDMFAIPFLARFAVPGLRMPLATRFVRAKSSGLKRDRCSRPPHRQTSMASPCLATVCISPAVLP
jgi:hypothetical protein